MAKAIAPKGYKDQSTDVVGMWDPELSSSIHFIPTGVKLFDSNLDKTKPSCLIIGRLVDDAILKLKEEEESNPVEAKPGDVIGVWYKPGMKAVLRHQNHKVWMTPNGEKNTGKPSPMKLFQVLSPDDPNADLLPVLEDTREKSLAVKTPFDKARAKPLSRSKPEREPGDDSEDEFNF